MQDQLEGSNNSEIYRKFIFDVIEGYTPKIIPYEGALPSNWEGVIFGNNNPLPWNSYGSFVSNILNLQIENQSSKDRKLIFYKNTDSNIEYSIISLNYDLVLENIVSFLHSTYKFPNAVGFVSNKSRGEKGEDKVNIMKLHGSIWPAPYFSTTRK
ncbi:hypothetical protein HY229_09245 [Candidatus Acetothermia bacterium]|nr:hypothetical protein [Candidatus Acetothermia bacterium]MBI3644267.1 hypothetical protein [Candidatus Acetothermia bacterium]